MSLLFLKPRTKKNYFQCTIKTDNLSTGSSNNNQFKLPLEVSGTYNFIIDWGDGSKNTINVWNQAEVTHPYSAIGTYPIKIYGDCDGFGFNNTGDRSKLLSVQRWGKIILNDSNFFYGCDNLTTIPNSTLKVAGISGGFRECTNLDSNINFDTSDAIITNYDTFLGACENFNSAVNIDTSKAESLAFFFLWCYKYNQPVSQFNTSNVKNFGYMFFGAIDFNQDISMWDFTSAEDMDNMLVGATAWSVENYGKFLISCASQDVNDGVTFKCSTKYTLGGVVEEARTYLIDIKGWSLSDLGGEL